MGYYIDAAKLAEALNSKPGHMQIDKGDLADAMNEAGVIEGEINGNPPRLLTIEEVLGGDECWIEGRSGACGYGDALISDDGKRVDFYRPHSIDTLDFYAYGKIWRCWTARPTEEQMEAIPWGD